MPDGDFYDPGPFTMNYTSYAGNFGTWHMGWTPQYNDRLNGLFNADGAVAARLGHRRVEQHDRLRRARAGDPRRRRSARLALVGLGLPSATRSSSRSTR